MYFFLERERNTVIELNKKGKLICFQTLACFQFIFFSCIFLNSQVRSRSCRCCCRGAAPKIRGRIKTSERSAASALLRRTEAKIRLASAGRSAFCEGDRPWDAGERLRGDLGTAATHLLEHLVGVRKSGTEPAGKWRGGGGGSFGRTCVESAVL